MRRSYSKENDFCEDNLIDYFLKRKFVNRVKCKNKKEIEVPESFTFYENVNETLYFLETIVYLISKKSLKELFINHCKIEKISLTASLILDLILMDTSKYIKKSKNKRSLNISGKVRKDDDVGILLHANGVLPHLGFDVEKNPNVRTLELLYGDPQKGNTLDPASDILKYFGECLKMQGCTMTKGGKSAFGKFLGEVLDNCKLHSGQTGRWYALGFYHNKKNSGTCHISILTLGNTIYESLSKRDSVSDETYNALKKMTDKHKKYFDNDWTEESLWTWLSLQHGVSRKRDSQITKNANRGMGTVEMMEGFQTIGKSVDNIKPIFTIISGHTMIKFDFEKYPIDKIILNDEERRVVSFNKEKSLECRPDENHVKTLKEHFPGTIYTMEFCIDPKFLENSEQNYVRRYE